MLQLSTNSIFIIVYKKQKQFTNLKKRRLLYKDKSLKPFSHFLDTFMSSLV